MWGQVQEASGPASWHPPASGKIGRVPTRALGHNVLSMDGQTGPRTASCLRAIGDGGQDMLAGAARIWVEQHSFVELEAQSGRLAILALFSKRPSCVVFRHSLPHYALRRSVSDPSRRGPCAAERSLAAHIILHGRADHASWHVQSLVGPTELLLGKRLVTGGALLPLIRHCSALKERVSDERFAGIRESSQMVDWLSHLPLSVGRWGTDISRSGFAGGLARRSIEAMAAFPVENPGAKRSPHW
jgi:hypothetical protein